MDMIDEINPNSFQEAKPWRERWALLMMDERPAMVRELWRRRVPVAVICVVTGWKRDAISQCLNKSAPA